MSGTKGLPSSSVVSFGGVAASQPTLVSPTTFNPSSSFMVGPSPPLRQFGGVEIFVEPRDASVAHLADHAGGERNLPAVGQGALEQMLFDEAAFEDVQPAPRVAALGNVADEAL